MKVALVFLMVLPSLFGETIILNDLPPEDVQARLAVQSLDLQYAKFLGQRALPVDVAAARLAEGNLNGSPEDYLQNTYQASQFHGQDGLGRAMFGYSDWNQGRLEARNANGEVRGSYQYVDAFGDDVIVNYWADSLGFHQTDNRRTGAMAPVTETPEVLAARLAHQRAWDAAARASQQTGDPMSDVYNANANRLDEERAEYEQAQLILAQQQQQQQLQQNANRYPVNNAVKTPQITRPEEDTADSDPIDEDTVYVQSVAAESRRNAQYLRGSRIEEQIAAASEDRGQQDDAQQAITGPPHGFYYSIDYPVQVVLEHPDIVAGRRLQQQQLQLQQQQQQAELLDNETRIRQPTIVQPDAQQQQQLQLQAATATSRSNADDLKLLPIRILDTKKIKRSDQSSRRRQQAAIRNRYQRQFAQPMAVASGRNNNIIPVQVIEARNAPSSASEIVQIKSLTEQEREQELRRLAGANADTVDAVHDAQVHPKQKARAEAARRYRRHF